MTDEQSLRATMLQAILAQGIPLSQAVEDAEAAVSYVLGTRQPTLEHLGNKRIDAVLDMWAAKLTAREIARQCGMKQSGVYNAINRARRVGDPRAVQKLDISNTERARRSDHARAMNIGRAKLDQPA